MVSLDDDGQTHQRLATTTGQNILTIEVQQGKITIEGRDARWWSRRRRSSSSRTPRTRSCSATSLLSYLNQLVQLFNTHMHPGELAAGRAAGHADDAGAAVHAADALDCSR